MSNNPILKGMTRGAQIVVARKVERRSFTPATAVQLQTKAWEMVGDSLRRAMDKESTSTR